MVQFDGSGLHLEYEIHKLNIHTQSAPVPHLTSACHLLWAGLLFWQTVNHLLHTHICLIVIAAGTVHKLRP